MATYDFTATYTGDTFAGVKFTVEVNGSPMDLSSTSIECKFRFKKKTGVVKKILTNGNGITITDAVNGKFEIDAFGVDLPAAVYYYDIQFTTGQVVKTYISGEFKVLQDVT